MIGLLLDLYEARMLNKRYQHSWNPTPIDYQKWNIIQFVIVPCIYEFSKYSVTP
jgi:hypothetical protein